MMAKKVGLVLSLLPETAVAGWAHAFFVIVAKMLWHEAAYFGFGQRGEEIAQGSEKIGVGADIGAYGMPNGILIENEKFVARLDAGKLSPHKIEAFFAFFFFQQSLFYSGP